MKAKDFSDKRIKYIVSYDCLENAMENRVSILASSNKIDYIVKKINDCGYGVDLISTSQTLNKKFYGGKKIKRGINDLYLFPTTPRGGVVLRSINVIVMRIAIAFFLMKNIKKNDMVMIYHSVGNMWLIKFLKKIKKVFIIEEVEEIYGDIYGKPNLAKRERYLLQFADAYIYPTVMLNSVVNKKNKEYIVVHGSYDVKEYKNVTKFRQEDGRYHIAYTGILDPKKGCLDFVSAAEYLDDTFHLHVLGFGSVAEVELLQTKMKYVSKNTTCKVSYDGVKRGALYEEYLQALDAGICPLDSSEMFTKTQFPSKVISYLANGLMVICSDVEAVRTSEPNEEIFFYSGNGAKSIADAIKRISTCDRGTDPRSIIKKCDEKFQEDICKLLKRG